MDGLSRPAAKAIIGLGAALALLLIARKLIAGPSGPGELESSPDSAPPVDAIVGDFLQPVNGSAVDVPPFEVPFGPKRVIPFTMRLRNRSSEQLAITPEVRLTFPAFGQVNNYPFEQLALGPGESRMVSGEVPLETPTTMLGQQIDAELHARVKYPTHSKDHTLARVTFFTQ